jgi:hypothetical protein
MIPDMAVKAKIIEEELQSKTSFHLDDIYPQPFHISSFSFTK